MFSQVSKTVRALEIGDSLRLKDMVVTLLIPSVQKAVNDFYSPYLTMNPTVVPWYGTEIISIVGGERLHEGVTNSQYTVELEVYPYIGPHISVGKDRIELSVKVDGVTVENYEHLKSYEITPNYLSILKRPLP